MRVTCAVTTAVLALGGVVSASTVADQSPVRAPQQAATSAYLPGDGDLSTAQNQRLQRTLDLAEQRASSGRAPAQAYTVFYDAAGSPGFAAEVAESAQIWNDRTDNVTLVDSPGQASLVYTEGSGSGSYYQGDGRGSGTIFIDYAQAQEYNPLRIVSHETGHALGLPDRYTQPCEKLMSGGGPGPSCTNPYPDAAEADEVDTIWGFAPAVELAPAA